MLSGPTFTCKKNRNPVRVVECGGDAHSAHSCYLSWEPIAAALQSEGKVILSGCAVIQGPGLNRQKIGAKLNRHTRP